MLSREQLERVILIPKPDTDLSMVFALNGIEFVQPSTGTTDILEPDSEQISEAEDIRKGEPGEEGEHPHRNIQEEGESTHVIDAQLHDQGMDKGEVNLEAGRVEGHLERKEGADRESAKLPAEEREQPLLTPEEVMATLAVRNTEYAGADRSVGEASIAEIRPTEGAEETTAENQRMREVEASPEGKQRTEQVPSREMIARTRDSPVRIYQRRSAREETSGRMSTEEEQKETSTQREEAVGNSPAKSGATPSSRKRRLLVVSESEEEEDVIFTPLDELPGSRPPA